MNKRPKIPGPETLAEYERRAGVSHALLLDMIRRDRARYLDSPSSHMPHSVVCNDPSIEAKGDLKDLEESKAWLMLLILAEYRDGKQECFSLRHAYTCAGIGRHTLIDWRKNHPMFDAMMESIQEEMVDTMRSEAYRRAVVGVDEPIFYQGVDTGNRVKKYSDSLLQFTLMGHDARYRSKEVNMNVSGQLDSNINIEGLRDKLASRLAAKAKAT
ncbi:MAG: hypothetical protein RIS70_2365 [Planctomycetota bacterium]|jgi:excinuclease UvrABC ATPase subunit